jgi:hypothetical protein
MGDYTRIKYYALSLAKLEIDFKKHQQAVIKRDREIWACISKSTIDYVEHSFFRSFDGSTRLFNLSYIEQVPFRSSTSDSTIAILNLQTPNRS